MDGALTLARAYRDKPETPRIFATAGVHPQEAAQCSDDALKKLDALLREPEVLACGEIGLDFYHQDNPPVAVQREAFRAQMELAAKHGKPVVIHCRPGTAFGEEADAWELTLAMLERHWRPSESGLGREAGRAPDRPAGILHCFSGERSHADRALALGFLISFAGNVTYPSAAALRQIAAGLPSDRYLVETDCPFLAPVPERGKRNEPALVRQTAELVAQVRGVSLQVLAEQTTENFHHLFHGTA